MRSLVPKTCHRSVSVRASRYAKTMLAEVALKLTIWLGEESIRALPFPT